MIIFYLYMMKVNPKERIKDGDKDSGKEPSTQALIPKHITGGTPQYLIVDWAKKVFLVTQRNAMQK